MTKIVVSHPHGNQNVNRVVSLLEKLNLLDSFVQKNYEINDKLQYVICGFDTRGSVTEINPNTGEQKKRDILPHETVWVNYEGIFTNKCYVIFTYSYS